MNIKISVMKRMIMVVFLGSIFISLTFSQNVNHHVGECTSLKSIEADDTFKSKGDVEKLFWGGFNAPVEFFYSPSFDGASGFRILTDSSKNAYMLEIKWISNYEWANGFNQSERFNHYKVDSLVFSINACLAEDLCKKYILFINNSKIKRAPQIKMDERTDGYSAMPCMPLDGYSVTFRTVVDGNVWLLNINKPKGDALKMADLCRQIITDAKADKLNEQEYIKVLDTFED